MNLFHFESNGSALRLRLTCEAASVFVNAYGAIVGGSPHAEVIEEGITAGLAALDEAPVPGPGLPETEPGQSCAVCQGTRKNPFAGDGVCGLCRPLSAENPYAGMTAEQIRDHALEDGWTGESNVKYALAALAYLAEREKCMVMSALLATLADEPEEVAATRLPWLHQIGAETSATVVEAAIAVLETV